MIDQTPKRNLCLILEDNWLIAEGLSEQLKQTGFEVVEYHTSCSDALSYLDQIKPELPDLALLDVTIGPNETCLPVALELERLGVPMVIISGHGAAHELKSHLPDVAALQKPVSNEKLCEMVAHVLGAADT